MALMITDECINCDVCEPECPNGAIYPEAQLPAGMADFAWIDAAWFRDRDVARDVLVEVLAVPVDAGS